jgi:hypothetical protein
MSIQNSRIFHISYVLTEFKVKSKQLIVNIVPSGVRNHLRDFYTLILSWKSMFLIYRSRRSLICYITKESHIENADEVVEKLRSVYCYSILCFTGNRLLLSKTIAGINIQYIHGWIPWLFVRNRLIFTPASGTAAYISERNNVVHLVHSLVDLRGAYRPGTFDYVDYVICAHKEQIIDLMGFKKVRPEMRLKGIIPGGYPKLDKGIRYAEINPTPKEKKRTIIFAPTIVNNQTQPYAVLERSAASMISAIINQGYKVIFRPHPVSFGDRSASSVREIISLFDGNENFTVDRTVDYFPTYSKADLLLTDLSGTAFTFSFSFKKPSIFFQLDHNVDLFFPGFQSDGRYEIGSVVNNIDEMILGIENYFSGEAAMCEISERIGAFRNSIIFNAGHSVEYISDCIAQLANGKWNNDWIAAK